MIIIGAVTVMICLVLYYLAMLLRESKNAVSDSRVVINDLTRTMKQVDLIVNDVQTSIATIRGTVEEVNQAILSPLRKLAYGFSLVTGFLGNIKNKHNKEEEEI